jgi:hypothetical protein
MSLQDDWDAATPAPKPAAKDLKSDWEAAAPKGATASFEAPPKDPLGFVKPEQPPFGFGPFEGMSHLLTGAIAKPLSDVAGLGSAAVNMIGKEALPMIGYPSTEIAGDPEKVREKTSELISRPPTTPSGKFVSQFNPAALFGRGWDVGGQKIGEVVGGDPKTASPLRQAAGQGAHELWNQLPTFLGGGASKVAEKTGEAMKAGGKDIYQSALKPGVKVMRRGGADPVVTTLLEKGINVTKGGVEKVRGMVTELDKKLSDKIANSSAMIDKEAVANYLQRSFDEFRNDVRGEKNVAKIEKIWDEWMNHPDLPKKIAASREPTGVLDAQGKPVMRDVPESGTNLFPVQKAQQLKQGTYRHLYDQYGNMKPVTIEATKDLARGLKEEIAKAVPEVRALNAQESKLLAALDPLERRVLQSANKNLVGMGWMTTSPAKFAAWMADRSELFKSLVGRMLYKGGKGVERLGDPIGKESLERSQDVDPKGPLMSPLDLLGILSTTQADRAKDQRNKAE